MDNEELEKQWQEYIDADKPPHAAIVYLRGVLGWNSPYAHRGLRFILEGFYMWLGPRLPAELVYRASVQMSQYAEQKGMSLYEFVEVQSLWLTDKVK